MVHLARGPRLLRRLLHSTHTTPRVAILCALLVSIYLTLCKFGFQGMPNSREGFIQKGYQFPILFPITCPQT